MRNLPYRLARSLALFWLSLAFIAGQSLAEEAADASAADAPAPIISPNDQREYRTLTLANGLEVLLISDADADKAAAAMNVSVGSAQDPENTPGLAHFLEHMLFLGTDRYPEADSYQQFISRHGGNHNAFTADQDTNYFFDIEPKTLPGALDRFSRFFVSPLFNEAYVDRERNAVHSEYQARLRDDGRRLGEAMDQALNPEHPATGFSVGSLETLQDGKRSLRQNLIDFYETYYGANVMHLSVVAPQSLDTLETWVRERFADIPDRGLSRPDIPERLLTAEQAPARLAVQSLENRRQVHFLFPADDPISDYRHKSLEYLGNLLGHEGEGSLLAALRQQGWADGLSAGSMRGDGDDALFAISISLTPSGAQHLARIQASLFAMIERIREDGLEAWRYDEQARLNEQEFRFQQRGEPLHLASRMAMNMARYPLKDVQYGRYRMAGFQEEQVRELLSRLTPEHLLRVYSAPDVQGEQRTRWFDTPYRLTSVDSWPSARPLDGLALPEPNPYIAENLDLLELDATAPQALIDREGYTLWYRPDSEFGTPRVEWRFSLQNPQASSSAHDAALTQLLAGWLNDSLNEALYPARLAGQDFSAYAHGRGITLSLSGWRDRQEQVLRRVLEQLKQGSIEADTFARVKLGLDREWRNAPQSPLYRQMQRTLSSALVRPRWPDTALLDALGSIEVEALRDFRDRFLARLRIESMAVGNLTPELARREGLLVANTLSPQLDDGDVPDLVTLDVPGSAPVLHPESTRNDQAVLRYLQGPDRSLTSQATLAVLGQMIGTPFYSQLRTEEQLGYIVNAGYQPLLDAPGLNLLVQSPSAEVEHIQARIDAFLEGFDRRIEQLDDEALAPYRDAVRDRLLERDPSLSSLTDRLWYELAFDETSFDRRERLAGRVSNLTPDDVREAWRALREAPAQRVTFTAGTSSSDVLSLTEDYTPLSKESR
ncbi:Secreted Zn-dependent peptidases, insulinase-like [Modicisalibacter ilicicola DSM 19980]|uniref:Protease 3 n=1 Tax=Modicisalibacter ilicicola DSM 19980 TaxID=1121942 RepID=A0A1M5E920_9GAMM|nr:insulinase family protein [Halomonas ilicicola]SHF75773.1 Secreted Zn-dependent peptidases, insulinase-like [Halomonas ilicicola DSM 19980]